LTYPGVLGVEKAKEIAKSLADEAIEALADFGQNADILRRLAIALLERTR
jgi:geranylgeranyl pyrophosphate synthase